MQSRTWFMDSAKKVKKTTVATKGTVSRWLILLHFAGVVASNVGRCWWGVVGVGVELYQPT
jgi:hypothetical protein